MTSIVFLLLLILSGLIFLVLRQRKHLRRLAETLQELKEIQEIKEIRANLEGRDQERLRIAKDWHDGIGNSLATLRLLFDTIQTKNQDRHSEALTLLEHTQREFRQIIDNELINNFSTEVAIHNCFEQWKRQFALGNIELNFKVYKLLSYNNVPIATKAHFYRMTQELLTNALRHSNASKIQVELKSIEGLLELSISDNGTGVTEIPTLRSIEDRLQRVDGQIQISSNAATGTMIQMSIPLKMY